MLRRFAVVGSGPSGIYTAKYLLKRYENCKVDIFEMLPTPYGLIRYGVAPDHADVKSVEKDFESVLQQEGVSYYGNVNIGTDILFQELKPLYSSLFLCYGANGNRELFLGKETLNVFNARDFVYWFNSHPHYSHVNPCLNGSSTAVIIGHGNVALDCARILGKRVSELESTDISEKALEALRESKIKNIHLVGRRGPLQAAFTIKELRELGRLDGCYLTVPSAQFQRGLDQASLQRIQQNRAKKRIFELLETFVNNKASNETEKKIEMNFLLAPKEVQSVEGKLVSTTFSPQELSVDSESVSKADSSWDVTIESNLVIKSIGFSGEALPQEEDVFDKKKTTLKHNGIGHVKDNIFTAGWIKRGATGIVGTNIVCAKQTLAALEETRESERKISSSSVEDLLREKKIEWVDYQGWNRINTEELRRGKEKRKVRIKIQTVSEMLEIARS